MELPEDLNPNQLPWLDFVYQSANCAVIFNRQSERYCVVSPEYPLGYSYTSRYDVQTLAHFAQPLLLSPQLLQTVRAVILNHAFAFSSDSCYPLENLTKVPLTAVSRAPAGACNAVLPRDKLRPRRVLSFNRKEECE